MKAYIEKTIKVSKEKFLQQLNNDFDNQKQSFIVTANPEIYMTGLSNEIYDKILRDRRVTIVPDGIGVVKAIKKAGYPIVERIAGVELCEALFVMANQKQASLFLYGAQPEVLADLIARIKSNWPNIKLVGWVDGYEKNETKVVELIKQSQPDILLVALGVPKQELFIYNNLAAFNCKIMMGVGGSFDVLSGNKKRAPQLFLKLNLEWLYRILKEPKRIKRFLKSNVKYFFEYRKIKHHEN